MYIGVYSPLLSCLLAKGSIAADETSTLSPQCSVGYRVCSVVAYLSPPLDYPAREETGFALLLCISPLPWNYLSREGT